MACPEQYRKEFFILSCLTISVKGQSVSLVVFNLVYLQDLETQIVILSHSFFHLLPHTHSQFPHSSMCTHFPLTPLCFTSPDSFSPVTLPLWSQSPTFFLSPLSQSVTFCVSLASVRGSCHTHSPVATKAKAKKKRGSEEEVHWLATAEQQQKVMKRMKLVSFKVL